MNIYTCRTIDLKKIKILCLFIRCFENISDEGYFIKISHFTFSLVILVCIVSQKLGLFHLLLVNSVITGCTFFGLSYFSVLHSRTYPLISGFRSVNQIEFYQRVSLFSHQSFQGQKISVSTSEV